MSILIKNGEIVTASERYVADIWCEGKTITRITPHIVPPPGAEVIDATGKYVFAGFIDPHVHIYLPCMGTFVKDTHETASKAALGNRNSNGTAITPSQIRQGMRAPASVAAAATASAAPAPVHGRIKASRSSPSAKAAFSPGWRLRQ